jgi:Spy/CpxP family protein refolding chaperone
MYKIIPALAVAILMFSSSPAMEMEEVIQAKTKFLVDGLELTQEQGDQISEIFRDQIAKMQDLIGDRGRPTLEEIEILDRYESTTRDLINRQLTSKQLRAFNQTDIDLLPAPQMLVLNERLDLTLEQAVKIRKIIREYLLEVSLIDLDRGNPSPESLKEIQKIRSEGEAEINKHLTDEQKKIFKRLLKDREKDLPGYKAVPVKGED